jgi:hypothetical protein
MTEFMWQDDLHDVAGFLKTYLDPVLALLRVKACDQP